MELRTAQLLLRPFTREDRDDLYAYARDPRVGLPAGWSPHRSPEESLEVIETVFAAPYVFAVVEAATGRVIGSAGYTGRSRKEFAAVNDEIGYALHPDYWGQGLMTQAVRALMGMGFAERKLACIWCSHYVGNIRSKRVMERCGFGYRFTDVIVDEPTGQEKQACFYALDRNEWFAQRA